MKHIILTVAFCAFALPVAAQEAPQQDPDIQVEPDAQTEEEGFNLMEEGMKLFFQGLLSEMGPAMDEMRDLAEELEPSIRELSLEMGEGFKALLDVMDEFRYYEAPEVLDNGDIIIRRRDDAPRYIAPEADGSIEL
ncbi:MAG: hypothetical protein JKX69_06950 [Rhodobacteraceae bacterium]|nr:hypothetical protein [Paracoccaceae bacterium]